MFEKQYMIVDGHVAFLEIDNQLMKSKKIVNKEVEKFSHFSKRFITNLQRGNFD